MSDSLRLESPVRTPGWRTFLPLVLIALAASTWAAMAFGLSPASRLIMMVVAALVIVVPFLWRWPAMAVAWLPVFMIPPQFAKVFAYEVILLMAAYGLFLLLFLRRDRSLTKLDGFEVAVWLLFGWAAFTGFWARDLWWYAFGVRKMLMGAIALWVSWRLCRYMKPDLLMIGIAAAAVALALATLAKAYEHGWFESVVQEFQRRSATDLGWGTSNYIAALLTVMLPTAIFLATAGPNPLARAVGWTALPLTAMVVTIAASRGGSLLVLGVALFAIFRSKIRPWIAVLAGAIAITLLLTGPGAKLLVDRFTDVKDMASVVVRLWYWRVAWVRIVDHFPFGMGLGGGYGYLDRLYTEDPHNYWLVMASELSLPGVLLWITVLVVLWRRISAMTRDPRTQAAGHALQLTFWISQLNTLFEPTFQGLHYHFLWYWIIGTYLGWAEQKRKEPPLSPAR